MNTPDNLDPVQIFAGTAWEAGMLISILSDNEIEAYLLGEGLDAVAPWIAEPSGAGSVKVVVTQKDYTRAIGIVNQFRETLK